MLQIMDLKISRETANKTQTAEVYTNIADEALDVPNITRLVVCLRWANKNLDSHEEFLDLHSNGIANANTIVKVLENILINKT